MCAIVFLFARNFTFPVLMKQVVWAHTFADEWETSKLKLVMKSNRQSNLKDKTLQYV